MFFRIVSLLAFLLILWWIYTALKSNPGLKKGLWHWIADQFKKSCNLAANFKSGEPSAFFQAFKKILYWLTILCVLILAVTGFFPVIVLGKHLSGLLLVIHVSVAPVFAVCMALIALFWAQQNAFVPGDWIWFKRLFNQNVNKTLAFGGKSEPGEKVGYWLLLSISLSLIFSILLSMFKFFGTGGQKFLLSLHGFSALLFLLVAVVHTYLIILHQKS